MKRRFVAKSLTTGRHTTWHVYDVERACYPAVVPGFGLVAQDHPTEQAAEAEADRLSAHSAGGLE